MKIYTEKNMYIHIAEKKRVKRQQRLDQFSLLSRCRILDISSVEVLFYRTRESSILLGGHGHEHANVLSTHERF